MFRKNNKNAECKIEENIYNKTNEYNKSRSEINIDLSIIKKLKDAMVRTYEVFIFLYMLIFKKIRYD